MANVFDDRPLLMTGTTVVRSLESAATGRGGVLPAQGRTDLFIYPGYRFRVPTEDWRGHGRIRGQASPGRRHYLGHVSRRNG